MWFRATALIPVVVDVHIYRITGDAVVSPSKGFLRRYTRLYNICLIFVVRWVGEEGVFNLRYTADGTCVTERMVYVTATTKSYGARNRFG